MAVEFDTSAPSFSDLYTGEWLEQRARSGRPDQQPGSGVLDVGPDRLSVRWERRQHDGFASYDDIWPVFADDLESFERLVTSNGHSSLPVGACELSYVNPFASGEDWQRRGVLERLLLQWSGIDPAETLLPTPDEIRTGTRYKIAGRDGAAVGRLNVSVHSVWLETPEPMILVTLSARGRPVGDGTEAVKVFFDAGFEWIVRGFASLTSTEGLLAD